ncbi:hypothetical protein [Clostridium sp. Cult3]|uniref:hypothetical protein n=1 Tax=Clostridium sp. Cult3 TaxID=2079004 RepID=UPI001F238693|nr:hypothetical protein [Clostridium sp. Cult3]
MILATPRQTIAHLGGCIFYALLGPTMVKYSGGVIGMDRKTIKIPDTYEQRKKE